MMKKHMALRALPAVLLAGCASNHVHVFESQKDLFQAGDFRGAAELIREKRSPKPTSRYFLDWINMGAGDFTAKEYEKSYADFESAESSLGEQDLQWKDGFSELGRNLKTGLFEGERYYQAWNCDESMLNIYKALSMLALGDVEKARIEFNRCEVRQGRSADRAEELMKRRTVRGARSGDGYLTWKRRAWNWGDMVHPHRPKAKGNEVSRKGLPKFDRILANSLKRQIDPDEPPTTFEQVEAMARCPGVDSVLAEYKDYEQYPDCFNPVGWFLCGAYRLVFGDDSSDWEKGCYYFREAAKCVPSGVVSNALEILDRRANGMDFNDYVCVVYENGLGSVLQGKQVDFELNTPYPIYKGLLLPGFSGRTLDGLRIETTDGVNRLGVLELIGDMDRMVGAEARRNFSNMVDGLLWRAKIRMASDLDELDAYCHEELPQMVQRGLIKPNLVSSYFQERCDSLMQKARESERLDIRMWSSLPRDFHAVIVPRPSSGMLCLKNVATGDLISEVMLPESTGNVFVYVKKVLPQVPASIFVNIKRR